MYFINEIAKNVLKIQKEGENEWKKELRNSKPVYIFEELEW